MTRSPAQGFSEQALLSVLTALPRPAGYWLAYSGGLDSSVLLQAMASLRGQLHTPFQVLHLDHGLHPDSPRWTEHCRDQCAALGLPFTSRSLKLDLQPGDSLEAKAREARLAVFREMLGPGEQLLTAQHRDDQAETVLLQLLRGSGLDGLAAMPRLAPLGAGHLARPLLDFSRAQLRQYADAKAISWIDDPSNAQLHFDRNYLRHRVLPLLQERWPSYAATFSRSASHCAEGRSLLNALEAPHLEAARGKREDSLSVGALKELEPSLCRDLLRRWIRDRGFALPDRVHLERIRNEVLAAAPDRNPLVQWPGAQVRRYRDELFLLPPLPAKPVGLSIPWEEGDCLVLPEGLGRLDIRSMEAANSLRKQGELSVRFGINALRCRPAADRPHRPLKHLYQEQGVPNWLRPYVPLLFVGEELRAVGGFWSCVESGMPGGGDWDLTWTDHPFEDLIEE